MPTLLILIHGIRTDAVWQEKIVKCLEKEESVSVRPIKYGRLDLFRFWFPLFFRTPVVNKVNASVQRTISQFPNHEVVIIAHSFGTFALAKAMEQNQLLSVSRLILCGSIIKRNFRWNIIDRQIARKSNTPMSKCVINECGSRDILPILAQSTTFGFGESGTFGFGAGEVLDRYHNISHSEYFTEEFIKKYWVPFIVSGDILHTIWESQRPITPVHYNLLRIPFKFLVLLVCFGLLGTASISAYAHFYNYRSMVVPFTQCGANIIIPARILSLSDSDRTYSGTERKMLRHVDGIAKIYVNGWKSSKSESIDSYLKTIRSRSRNVFDMPKPKSDFGNISGEINFEDNTRMHYNYTIKYDKKNEKYMSFTFIYDHSSGSSDRYKFLSEMVSKTLKPDAEISNLGSYCNYKGILLEDESFQLK